MRRVLLFLWFPFMHQETNASGSEVPLLGFQNYSQGKCYSLWETVLHFPFCFLLPHNWRCRSMIDQTLIWFMYGMSTNIIFLLYLSLPFFNIYWTNHQIRILLKIVLFEIIKNLKYNSEAFNNLYYMFNNYIKSHE